MQQKTPVSPTARLARRLARVAFAAALVLPALLPGLAYAEKPPEPPDVPGAIEVKDGSVPFLKGHAIGTQNYICRYTSGSYSWVFDAPEATLFDVKNKAIITHFRGPTRMARDGSTVVGARVDGVNFAGTIPWLLLSAASTTEGPDGDKLTKTTFIQRINTTGGLAPTIVCDGDALGDLEKVPYTADYYFYRHKGS